MPLFEVGPAACARSRERRASGVERRRRSLRDADFLERSWIFLVDTSTVKEQFGSAMVKTYNRFALSQTFGTIYSASSNVLSLAYEGSRASKAGRAVLAANEEVFTWDVKKGELLGRWKDGQNTAQVTAIARSATDADLFAVGYGAFFS